MPKSAQSESTVKLGDGLTSVSNAPSVTTEQSSWKTPQTRKDKKAVMTYLSKDAHKALKTLALEQDKTIKELMDEAVSGLFRSYGKTPIK